MVVTSFNPIHSVLFLVLVFFWGSAIMFMLRLDFVAVVFIMIYAGAIAVLFLFVIMMLNVKLIELTSLFMMYLPVGVLLVLGFALEFFVYFYALGGEEASVLGDSEVFLVFDEFRNWFVFLGYRGNVYILGAVLYTYYGFLVIINAYILLIAMMASVFLTLRRK
jgi:NADH-quinone oxidoreductase subunit J